MDQALVFLLLGLGNGAVFAALGLGLVVTYRSSGVVNFSTGAVALYVAYTYAFLRNGRLLDPIPGLPVTVKVSDSMGFVPAVAVSLLIGALLGAVLYVLVFRPLRTAPAAAKAVASIAVMLLMQALLAARVGTNPVSADSIFPTHIYTIGSSRIPGDRLWFAFTIVCVAIALSVWFRLTRFGLATRAAAESEKGALVTGLSPQRIAVVNWALSTAIAGLSGILIAPIVPLTPISYTLFIVPAMAAALVGNFTRIPITVLGGLVIGMLQSEMTFVQSRPSAPSWLPKAGLAELIPLLVILTFLIFGGQRLPSRGAIIQQTLGRAPRPRGVVAPGVLLAGAAVLGMALTDGSYRFAIITSVIFAVISLSQVVITGFTGQISLAQLTLAGVAAFALTRLQHQMHIPFPIAPILAAVAAMVIGVLVGLPALRIRGLPVAVATLALAVAVEALWFNNPQFNGGFKGAPIKDAKLFGLDLSVGSGTAAPRLAFGIFVLVVLLLVAGGVVYLRQSRLGASMLAVRANERSAAAAGIDVSRTKIIAFAIGGFIAGLGGCLLAYEQTVASASSFASLAGIGLFATAYLAGITSVSGGILAGVLGSGGLLFTFFNDKLSSAGPYYQTIMGVLLLVTVITNPEGLVGEIHRQIAWVRRRVGRTSAKVEAPAELGLDKITQEYSRRPTPGSTAADATTPSPATGDVLLAVDNVGVHYGGVVAVDGVSFDVRQGEIVGLIGPNGAGKTTLIDAVSGYAASQGDVRLGGDDLHGLKPHRRSRIGLGRTFQGIELYEDLTVRENVEVGTTAARFSPAGAPTSADLDRYYKILHLNDVADVPVRELSVGQRQLVSVARALAGRPRIVLLDEPAAGLDTTESRWLGERLRAIRAEGITIVMVDHDMNLVLEVCDRIVVLDLGKKIADGTPSEIMRTPEVTRAYLGTTHTTAGAAI